MMKYNRIHLLFLIILLLVACVRPLTMHGESVKPGFRVRSDFAAPLNLNLGWAGALSENVVVYADQPFRIRFESECAAIPPTGGQQFQLQYRRNSGTWTHVETHDFPHPEREIGIKFDQRESDTQPEGWSVVKGDVSGLAVVNDSLQNVLRAKADQEPLVGLYTPPWDATEMAAEIRFPPDNHDGMAFMIGYSDIHNYYQVQLDPVQGTIRVSHVINGTEKILIVENTVIPFDEWLEIEIDAEGKEIEVNFQDGQLEMNVELETVIPLSHLGFQVPANSTIDFQECSFAGKAKTPRVSIVSCPAYEHGMSTNDLLDSSTVPFQAGTGISLADQTPLWSGKNAHGEFEWPLVIRRFADGAVINNEGDTFEFRMVDATGSILRVVHHPMLRLSIPPFHVGGTFIENPGRIGPWQASNGDLYFMMEPTETDNVFMMIKSTDNGRTWSEVDAANRPRTNDLESVDSRFVGDSIHIIHQVTRSTRYHLFRTSDHPTHPDTWAIRDEEAGCVDAVAQMASMVVRSDGSIVAFYLGQEKIHYSIRSPEGAWSQVRTIDPSAPPNQAGPQAVLGENDVIHLAYYGTDGTIWYRRFHPDGTFTPRQQLATNVGTSRAEYGAILPLLFITEKNEVVIMYRLASAHLWERRVVNHAPPTKAVRVSDLKVITDAVDSQQVGADTVLDGETVHVLFIEESSRSIFSTHDNGGWQPAKIQVGNILGSWVRGNVYTRNDGMRVYGYIYDAGSNGGAGMNRFDELILNGR